MEPLTALGLASNILSFVDFAIKLISESREIYRLASPSSEDNLILDIVAQDLQRLSDGLVISAVCPDALRQVAAETQRVSQELRNVLYKLRVKGRKTKWKSFIAAVQEVRSHDEVQAMAVRLSRLQTQLNTHMQVLIRYHANPVQS